MSERTLTRAMLAALDALLRAEASQDAPRIREARQRYTKACAMLARRFDG